MDTTKLQRLGPCEEALKWAGKQTSQQSAWDTCERGDWMLWLLGKLSGPPWGEKRKPLVLTACECARLALRYTKDERVLKCIKIAEAWTRGEATKKQVLDVRSAAYAAAYADADAASAAYAAAAAAAADAVYASAAAVDAAADADAAYAAAYAAASTADAYARRSILKVCAGIVRKHYPKAPRLRE